MLLAVVVVIVSLAKVVMDRGVASGASSCLRVWVLGRPLASALNSVSLFGGASAGRCWLA